MGIHTSRWAWHAPMSLENIQLRLTHLREAKGRPRGWHRDHLCCPLQVQRGTKGWVSSGTFICDRMGWGSTWKTYNLNNNSFTLELLEVFCCFILLFALDQEEKRDTDLSVELLIALTHAGQCQCCWRKRLESLCVVSIRKKHADWWWPSWFWFWFCSYLTGVECCAFAQRQLWCYYG